MKKLVALLLTAALLLGLSATAMAETTTVKFWTHQNVAWNESYEGLIKDFEAANPDIKIEYTTFPYNDFEAKIQTSLMGGDVGADVYEVWGGWMLDLVSNGVLCEAPADFIDALKEDAYAPVLGALEKDGKYYGAPLELNAEYGGMVVNKHLFDEAGLEYPTTWAQVMEIAKAVAVPDGDTMAMRGLEFNALDNLTFNWLAMILQKGGSYLKEDGSLDFTSPEAVESFTEMVSWVKDDHVTNLEGLLATTGLENYDFLGMDEAYMITRGSWVLSELINTYGFEAGVDYDYIAEPPFVEGVDQKWAAETGWSLCVPKNTAVADAAWRFVEFLLEPANLERHNIECAQIPPRASVANDPAFVEAAPYLKPLIPILDKAVFIGRFNTDILKEYVQQTFTSLVTEDGSFASVEEACQKLTDNLAANMKIY